MEGVLPHTARLKSLGLLSARSFCFQRRSREITGDVVRDAWILRDEPIRAHVPDRRVSVTGSAQTAAIVAASGSLST